MMRAQQAGARRLPHFLPPASPWPTRPATSRRCWPTTSASSTRRAAPIVVSFFLNEITGQLRRGRGPHGPGDPSDRRVLRPISWPVPPTAASPSPSSPSAPSPAASPWIARPWVDLVVGCGGWSLPLLAVSYLLTGDSARDWAGGFYALALLANYPTTWPRCTGPTASLTVRRTASTPSTAPPRWSRLARSAHADLRLLPMLFTAYVMWSPWHYSGQNYGLLMMFVRRGGLDRAARAGAAAEARVRRLLRDAAGGVQRRAVGRSDGAVARPPGRGHARRRRTRRRWSSSRSGRRRCGRSCAARRGGRPRRCCCISPRGCGSSPRSRWRGPPTSPRRRPATAPASSP